MLIVLLALAGSAAAQPRQTPLERPHRETRDEAGEFATQVGD